MTQVYNPAVWHISNGFYYGSAILTLLVVISLFLLNKFERKFSRNKRKRELVMKVQKSSSSLNQVVSELNRNGFQISKVLVENDETLDMDDKSLLIVRIQVESRYSYFL